ncbi:MAG: porin [Burkholderiaceae bacterium]|nr:porin [Burkholderiaceae bacterium]
MNKSLIAVAIAAAVPALGQAQTNVTMYGIADAAIASVRSGNPGTRNTIRLDSGTQSTSRWGIRGTEELGGGLKALFNFEAQMTVDDGTAAGLNFQRRSFVGLGANWGHVQLGRDYTPSFWSLLASDTFGYGLWGNTLSYSNFYATRYSNMIEFRSASMGGLEFNAAYSAGENTNSAFPSSAGSGMDISALYNAGPLMLTGAYQVNKNLTGKQQKVASLGAGFGVGAFGLKGGYSQSDSKDQGGDKIKMFNLGGTVKVGAGEVLAQYIRLKNDRTNGKGDTFALAYTYPLSRRTNIHASLAVHRNNNEGNFGINSSATSAGVITNGSDPRAFAVGVRHTF